MRKRRPQNALKNGFGRVLGSIWEGVGTVWAVFWALFDCPFDALNPSFFKHRSGKGFKRPFGSILDRFWRVLGGFGMDFERFGEGSGKIFYVRTPALSREAPRSVPMRRGPRRASERTLPRVRLPGQVLPEGKIWGRVGRRARPTCVSWVTFSEFVTVTSHFSGFWGAS